MPWGAVAGAAIGLVGASMQSDAAQSAADAQAQSAAQADATQRYMYDQTRADQAPYRDAGYDALAQLRSGMQPGGEFARKFSTADLANDTVYNSGLQFGLAEGEKGITNQQSATGNMLSGATLKALTRFGNDYASTKAGDAYNRFTNDQTNKYNKLAGLSGTGQQANSLVASSGQNMANNVAQNALGVGNARAASSIAQGNAWSGALNNGVNNWQQQQYMNRLFPQNNSFWESGGGYSAASGSGGYYPYGGSSYDVGNYS